MALSTNAKLGLPYRGSKRRLAAKVIDLLPSASVLVDVFAGGCAVTHAALLSGKFDRVIANDLSDAPELFYRVAKSGGIELRWVSREEFYALKDRDPLIRYIYSFGNAGTDYLYGLGIEPLKYAVHRAVVDGDCSSLPSDIREPMRIALNSTSGIRERYSCYKRMLRELGKCFILQHLEYLERLERLEHLEHLERLVISRRDYRDVYIPDNAVVYCDPPYASTRGYGRGFDHGPFYAWCRAIGRRSPLYVSEYWMPSDFKVVAEFEVSALFGAKTNDQTRIEKIFTI